IDDLEHGLLVDTEFFPWKKSGECPEKNDYELISKLDVQSGPLHDMILDLVQHRSAVLSNKVRASDASAIRQRYHTDSSPWPAAFKKEMEFEHAFAQAGGLLLAGLDPTGMGGVIAGFGDQREMELLVEAGFTPLE